jgi:hypothetical protein
MRNTIRLEENKPMDTADIPILGIRKIVIAIDRMKITRFIQTSSFERSNPLSICEYI